MSELSPETLAKAFEQLRVEFEKKKQIIPDFYTQGQLLAAVELGKSQERELIIQMLEDFPHPHWSPDKYIDYVEAYHSGWESAIAYLQGEVIEDVHAEAEWYYKMKEQLLPTKEEK